MIERRTILGLAAVAAIATPASAQNNTYATPVGSLDGVWEGSLGPVSGSGVQPVRIDRVRLVIDGERVQAFTYPEGTMTELKPGTFQLRRDGTNAVISSIEIDPGRPRNQGWVETWCFAVTLHDSDTLIANFVRVVNNNDLEPDQPGTRFSQMAAGQLQRLDIDV